MNSFIYQHKTSQIEAFPIILVSVLLSEVIIKAKRSKKRRRIDGTFFG
jgi:hypothetical protein